ncbi:MAG: GNAT family N-acetyltransferase [Beutenbergiaceae bacterium]
MTSGPHQLLTGRLRLRRWSEADREPFARLNADPAVMRYLGAALTRAESDALITRIEACFETQGLGLWAVEVTETGTFAGCVGLWPATVDAPFQPAIEVVWRLARPMWGNGYAREAAHAALTDGFTRLGLSEVVAVTAVINRRSQAVMRSLGMRREPAWDFDHPRLAAGDRLRPHVLYRISTADLRTT